MRPVLWTLCALSLPAMAGDFPEALTHPILAKVDRWKWPQPRAFTQAWEASASSRKGYALISARIVAVEEPALRNEDADAAHFPDAATLGKRIARGDGVSRAETLFLEERRGDELTLEPLLPSDDWQASRTWRVQRKVGNSFDASTWGGAARIEVLRRYEGTEVPESAAAEWTYAATLLSASGPLYAEVPTEARHRWDRSSVPEATRKALQKGSLSRGDVQTLSAGLSPYDDTWEDVIAYAHAAKDEALQLEAYRHFQPMGHCSMDTRPQKVAGDYAELCYQRGDLGCFLQLHVRIIGDQFERVAYSSYGEAAHGTEVERLASTGIDVRRFLRGLLIQLPIDVAPRGGELGPSRLARAFIEAGNADYFRAELPKMAADPTLDTWNRVRATMTYASLLFREGRSKEDVDATLAKLELPAQANWWWSALKKRRY